MKEKKAKLKLEDIKVESFVTSDSTHTIGEGVSLVFTEPCHASCAGDGQCYTFPITQCGCSTTPVCPD